MSRSDHGVSTPLIILVVALVLAGVVAFLAVWQHQAVSKRALVSVRRPVLSAEQKAYLDSLVLADFRMSAADNFLGNTVTYLEGNVTNNGTRSVRRLDVELNFVDSLQQVVLRETAHPLAGRATPLQPGETQAFRVTLEHIPVDWNQMLPSAKAVYVEF